MQVMQVWIYEHAPAAQGIFSSSSTGCRRMPCRSHTYRLLRGSVRRSASGRARTPDHKAGTPPLLEMRCLRNSSNDPYTRARQLSKRCRM